MRYGPRKRAKPDANQASIVKALRQVGCSVLILSGNSHGCPDLLVARNGRMWLMEIKDGSKPPSAQKLTKDEIEWDEKWQAPVHVVNSIELAVKIVTNLYE